MRVTEAVDNLQLEYRMRHLGKLISFRKISAEQVVLIKEFLLGIYTDGYDAGLDDCENGK